MAHSSGVVIIVFLAICGAIESTAFNSTRPLDALTFGTNYPTNNTKNEWTYGASIAFNVSKATFVDTRSSFFIRDDAVYNATERFTAEGSDVITGAYGTIVSPCSIPAATGTYFYINQFNATTDGEGEATYYFGEVEIPTWQNESTSEVKCRVPNIKCNDYYSLTISTVPVSQMWQLTVESTKNITVYLYAKQNNTKCERELYIITGGKAETIPLIELNLPIDYWLGIEVTDPSLTSQVKMWWQLLATDAPTNGPHNGPLNSPSGSGSITDELPHWAIALLVIFAAAILVLIIVLIALCIKRRKRVNYSTI